MAKIQTIPKLYISPICWNMITHEPDAIGQGTWPIGKNDGFLYNGNFFNLVASDGDNFTCDFYSAAGTYKLRFNAPKNNNYGKIDIDIDGVEKGSFDLYAASLDAVNIAEIMGIVLKAGKHQLKVRVDGKNASSSGYQVSLSGFSLTKTS